MSSRGGTRFQPIRVAEECSLSSHPRRSGMHWEILDRRWCFRIGGPGECLASGPGSLPVPQTSQLDRSPVCPGNPPYQEEVASRWRCRDSNWSRGCWRQPEVGRGWNLQIPATRTVWKESSGFSLHCRDLWTPAPLWGVQLCLGETARSRAGWRRHERAWDPVLDHD